MLRESPLTHKRPAREANLSINSKHQSCPVFHPRGTVGMSSSNTLLLSGIFTSTWTNPLHHFPRSYYQWDCPSLPTAPAAQQLKEMNCFLSDRPSRCCKGAWPICHEVYPALKHWGGDRTRCPFVEEHNTSHLYHARVNNALVYGGERPSCRF